MPPSHYACKLCEGESRIIHVPASSEVELVISQCNTCDFVQGNKGQLQKYRRPGTTDYLGCDANYAPFRIGKAQMLNSHRGIVKDQLAKLPPGSRILDIAAGRGDFAKFVLEDFPDLSITLVEHSKEFLDELEGIFSENSKVRCLEFKELREFEESDFAFIYSVHSLEHFDNPRFALQVAVDKIGSGGLMFLEVPDLGSMDVGTIVEDYFYDEHLSYFTQDTLGRLCSEVGLQIEEVCKSRGSISLLLRPASVSISSALIGSERNDLSAYSHNLHSNRASLKSDVNTIRQVIGKLGRPVVAVGCGRRFDAFRIYGKMELGLFDIFVDTYLRRAVPTFHGKPLYSLQEVLSMPIENPFFVVFANSSHLEIQSVLVSHGIDERNMIFV